MQGRGQLTTRILKASMRLLGYEISVTELRLMPYLWDCLLNNCSVSRDKINIYEIDIFERWKNSGFILYTNLYIDHIVITKRFYKALCELLWLSYINIGK